MPASGGFLAALPELDPHRLTGAALVLTVTLLVFAESGVLAGFFLPGDTVLFAAGLVTADPAAGVALPALVIPVVAAAVAGDQLAYTTGRRLGRPFLRRRWSGRVDDAERLFARWGWFAVVAARFIPWLRVFVPVLAGSAAFPRRRFLVANAVGAVCWGAGLPVLGRLAAASPALRTAAVAVAGVSVVAACVPAVWRLALRARSHRTRGNLHRCRQTSSR